MGWPKKEAAVKALGVARPRQPSKLQKVKLLGYNRDLNWKQDNAALRVKMPAEKISDIGVTLMVELA